MDHYEVLQLYNYKLEALQLWAQQQGLSCKNCSHGDPGDESPCDHCWMCASFEPRPQWLTEDLDADTEKYIKGLEASLYEPYEPCCCDCQYYDDTSGDDYDCPLNPNHGGPCEDFVPDTRCTPTPEARLTKLLHGLVDRLYSHPQDMDCRAALDYFLAYRIKERDDDKERCI